jgi:hypothetical protein
MEGDMQLAPVTDHPFDKPPVSTPALERMVEVMLERTGAHGCCTTEDLLLADFTSAEIAEHLDDARRLVRERIVRRNVIRHTGPARPASARPLSLPRDMRVDIIDAGGGTFSRNASLREALGDGEQSYDEVAAAILGAGFAMVGGGAAPAYRIRAAGGGGNRNTGGVSSAGDRPLPPFPLPVRVEPSQSDGGRKFVLLSGDRRILLKTMTDRPRDRAAIEFIADLVNFHAGDL